MAKVCENVMFESSLLTFGDLEMNHLGFGNLFQGKSRAPQGGTGSCQTACPRTGRATAQGRCKALGRATLGATERRAQKHPGPADDQAQDVVVYTQMGQKWQKHRSKINFYSPRGKEF